MRPVDWKATQTALAKAGYDPGPIDGAPGMTDPRRPPDVRTLRALLSFAASRDTGEFGTKAGLICGTMLPKYGISASRDSLAQFLATTSHETGDYTLFAENLMYTNAARLVKLWPNRFPTLESARPYLRNPRALAEKLYSYEARHGTKYDLGNRKGTTDAYDMRGGGWIQTTGYANYLAAEKVTGLPLTLHPEILHDAYTSIEPACAYFEKRGCCELANDDPSGHKGRVRVNGGTIGLDDVMTRTARNLTVIR